MVEAVTWTVVDPGLESTISFPALVPDCSRSSSYLSVCTLHSWIDRLEHGRSFLLDPSQPLLVLQLETGDTLALVQVEFQFKLVVESLTFMQLHKSPFHELLEDLQLEHLLQTRLHGSCS